MTDDPASPPPVNLFTELPLATGAEDVAALLVRPDLAIERIVSTGQASPPGFWYDQDFDEWVALLSGAAHLTFDGEPGRSLVPGDHLLIPAHRRHRVAWTHPTLPTVWLAVRLRPA